MGRKLQPVLSFRPVNIGVMWEVLGIVTFRTEPSRTSRLPMERAVDETAASLTRQRLHSGFSVSRTDNPECGG
jgi:hypothetical protein